MSHEKRKAKKRLLELEHSRLLVESLRLEVEGRRRREKMARLILNRQAWKDYVV